jgi:hypothetical protein
MSSERNQEDIQNEFKFPGVVALEDKIMRIVYFELCNITSLLENPNVFLAEYLGAWTHILVSG